MTKIIVCRRCGRLFDVSLLTERTPVHEDYRKTRPGFCTGGDKHPRGPSSWREVAAFLEAHIRHQRTRS